MISRNTRMVRTGLGMIKGNWLIAFLLLNLVALSLEAKPPKSWEFYNFMHGDSYVQRSEQAQNGSTLAVLDTTKLSFEKKEIIKTFSYLTSAGKRKTGERIETLDIWTTPEAYLFQTVNAKPYRNQHLHISAFVRGVSPDPRELVDSYEKELIEMKKEEAIDNWDKKTKTRPKFRDRFDDFFNAEKFIENIKREKQRLVKRIQESARTAKYGMWIILHFPPTQLTRTYSEFEKSQIYLDNILYKPTTANLIGPKDKWHRLNFEVSIPENCEAISIIFFADGVVQAEVDHVAVVRHGEILKEPEKSSSHFFELNDEFKDNIESSQKGWLDDFQNLGFEN